MKSVEVKLNEALEALKKAGKRKEFEEKINPLKEKLGLVPVEQQLNCAEEVLKAAGVVRESHPIKKNNGAGDNYVEGNPLRATAEEFRESSNNFSPGYIKEVKNPFAKGDKIMFDHMLKTGQITEAQHRKMTGQKPVGYDALTEAQRKDFDFSVRIGISEADAFKLTKLTGTTLK